MVLIPCRYCGKKVLQKEILRISEYPAIASWYNSHYSNCRGLSKYLQCLCSDLRYRCKCDVCSKCMKSINPECASKDHPKIDKDLIEIFNREQLCKDSSPRTIRKQLLETLEPLENIVKSYDTKVDSDPDLKIL